MLRMGGVMTTGNGSPRHGRAAMKLIVISGACIFFILVLVSQVMKRAMVRDEAQRVAPVTAQSPFDGQRAFRDLENIVAHGPRPAGSEALDGLRAFLREQLTAAGLEVKEQVFRAETPLGPRRLVNLRAVVRGSKPGVIVLTTHHETKDLSSTVFVGANASASGTAWLLEMARAIGPSREGRAVWLVFLDGEESFGKGPTAEGLYGSRAFVDAARDRQALQTIDAVINVARIGDAYLGVAKDTGAPSWLTDAVWNQAKALGHGSHFASRASRSEDSHVAFRIAGRASLNIIDPEYGGSPMAHREARYTATDGLDRVSPHSLQVIGDVIYHALGDIEGYLDTGQGNP
jgi:Peptidase family M28